jgi:hypothetical protein
MRQFLDHAQSEDRSRHGMVEYVQPDQTRVEVAISRGVDWI